MNDMKTLLAEAAYQGRDFATAVRCKLTGLNSDLGPDAARDVLVYERSALHGAIRRRIFDKQSAPVSEDDQKKIIAVAEAAFLQRMMGEA